MPRPRPPSRVEPLTFPVFAISWFVDPSTGQSITAYTGGGGSAKTGVCNKIVIVQAQHDDDDESRELSTGDSVGVALHIYQNPVTRRMAMVVALSGGTVHRYSMPSGVQTGEALVVVVADDGTEGEQPRDGCNALAVNAMADQLAVGCDSGLIKVYRVVDETFGGNVAPLYVCQGHSKAVCALSFSARGGRLLSSAKDGTARVWNADASGGADGECLTEMKCSVQDPSGAGPPPRGQVLVRGCVFVDLEGKVAITVASARRGKAFLSRWVEKDSSSSSGNFACAVRTACSPCPISAMSMSQDAGLLALGSVDGSIILWSVADWKPLKTFKEVHELPVTCIAARPYPIALTGEEEVTGVQIHARSASADSQLACLTLQRRAPKRQGESSSSSGGSFMLFVHRFLIVAVLAWILSPVAKEARQKCAHEATNGFNSLRRCIVDEVLIAPSSRPGISTPPY